MIETTSKKAIFLHLFYEDLWDEFRNYLIQFPFKFDLYVSLHNQSPTINITRSDILFSFPTAQILNIPNRGTDIGPFLLGIDLMIKNNMKYDHIIKCHSKKSIYNIAMGRNWRRELIEPILRKENAIMIERLMQQNQRLGMVGSKKWIRKVNGINDLVNACGNQQFIRYYMEKFKLKDLPYSFIGGTMFWIRSDILYEFFYQYNIVEIVQELEPGYYRDPSKTHAFERLFGIIVANSKAPSIVGI